MAGRDITALWQGAPWADLTITGGMVLGSSAARVYAIRAATGAPAWTASLPPSLPDILGLVPAGRVVVVEAGQGFGQAPAAVYPAVSEYIALDVATGRQLWAVPVGGEYQNPLIAAAGRLVLTGEPSGDLTARNATTGMVVWRDRRPAHCGVPGGYGPAGEGLGVAGDGSLVVVSFDCASTVGRYLAPVESVIVQRLDPASGRPLWTWRPPAAASTPFSQLQLTVAGAAGDGSVVVLTGQIASFPARENFASRLPRTQLWPAQLGPPDKASTMLVLDAATGVPRWSEIGTGSGSQQERLTLTLTHRAVCEIVSAGLECRDDATGAATVPALATGVPRGGGLAAVSGSIAAITVPPVRSGSITLLIVPVRGGAHFEARLAMGSDRGSSPFVVAAGPLPGGATLILVSPGSKLGVLALRVPGQ